MIPFLQAVLWVLVALPFALLALVFIAAAIGRRSLERSIRFASTSPCPKCGKAVGRAAVLAAKDRFSKSSQQLRKARPGVKYLTISEWEIECPHCSSKFYFYPAGDRIEALSVRANS